MIKVKKCNICNKHRNVNGGKVVFNADTEAKMWVCYNCIMDIEPLTSAKQLNKLIKSGRINFK